MKKRENTLTLLFVFLNIIEYVYEESLYYFISQIYDDVSGSKW
jgi:hypothetical protein